MPRTTSEHGDSRQAVSTPGAGNADHAVFELRQYTLHAGRRDDLIDLFESRLVEPQEAVGMCVVGTFRDRDDADRFVWLRSFADMASRRDALTDFYGGPVWAAHRAAANETMVDSDDVLLLRNTVPAHALAGATPERSGDSLVLVTIYLTESDADDLVDWLTTHVHPLLERVLQVPVATMRTEASENDFPALPVRSRDNVFVWIAVFEDTDRYTLARARLESDPGWTGVVEPRLIEQLLGRQTLRLQPTERSAFPGTSSA